MEKKNGTGKARIYLEDIPREEAWRRLEDALEPVGGLEPLPGEEVSLEEALGRVTACPVWAKLSSPHYHAAAMDGVAVRAEETRGASESSPRRLRIGEQAQWVNTGDPMPPDYNAVIMLEHLQQVEQDVIEIRAAVAPWQHVRSLGEDIVATEMVLPENHTLRPVDIGAAAACGLTRLKVRRRPRVALIPTGSELVPPGAALKPGDIIEFNSLMLAGLVKEGGGEATRLSPVPDDLELLKQSIRQALKEHDIVVVNAGSSAGERDYTPQAIAELGEVLVHGVAVRPGHPVVLGVVGKKPVLGIPGYPVSAVLTFELFVQPLLQRLLGRKMAERPRREAVMTRKVLSPSGEEEFLRVKLGRVGDKTVATPIQRGAGVIMSLVRADGLVRIPRFSEGVHAGQKVLVELLRRPEEVEDTIVAIGSHDLTLDLLANHLRRRYPPRILSSSNVGSLGGLMALRQGEAHLAGCNLLDQETGEYNVPQVRRLLPDREVVVVNMAYREQGLIVAKGNPKGISSLRDLVREEVSFVNRHSGAGTRVLLESRLRELGISPEQINGYERAEPTHLAVAAAVASGTADVGLGIRAAARALNLDFVPLWKERYDLVIPREHYDSPLLQPLLEVLNDPDFHAEVEALGGYDVSQMGQVIARIPEGGGK
jgi:putative molybdopterin biosynthesis protein